MKKFKNVFMVLVLALVLTAGAKVVSIWANETREITVNVEKSYKDAKTKVFVGSLSGQEIVAGDLLVDIYDTTTMSGSGQMTVAAGEVAYLYIQPNANVEYEVSADNKYIPLKNGGYTIPADQNEVVVKAIYKSQEERHQETETEINKKEGVVYDFETQNMLIKGSGIYYQFMKTADASSEQAKEKSWIPAPYNEDWENNYSTIDCSGLTKTTYVAIGIMKTDDEGNSAITEVRRVALEVNINKLKVVIDCKSELPELLEEALAEIDITYADGTTKAYKKTIGKNNKITFVDGTETLSSDYHFQWRKGATGKWVLWSDTSDQNKFSISYQTLKASNGTLYIRAFKNQDKDSQIDGLFSKEVKVKIAKTAKAPTVKIDYAKGTLAIKNGMEFRYNGKTYYVPATNKDAESEVRITDDATITATKTKVASISLEEIVTLFNIPDGKPFVLEVRTSATEKKYASYYYKVTGLVAPSDPVGEITTELTKDSKDKPILKVTFPEKDKYEYYLSSVEVTDFSAVKFTTAKATAVDIKNTANKDASTKKTLAPAAGQYLYYREAGNKNTTTFPSKIACITVRDNSSFEVTFNIASSATGATVKIKEGEEFKEFESGTALKSGTYTFKVEKTVDAWSKLLYVVQGDKELGKKNAEADDETLSVEVEVKVEDNTTITVSVEDYAVVYCSSTACKLGSWTGGNVVGATDENIPDVKEDGNIIPLNKPVTLTITFTPMDGHTLDKVVVRVDSTELTATGSNGNYTVTIPADMITAVGNLNIGAYVIYSN